MQQKDLLTECAEKFGKNEVCSFQSVLCIKLFKRNKVSLESNNITKEQT